MDTLQDKQSRLIELRLDLDAAYQDAFYSECLNPQTPEDQAHNQRLVYEIEATKDKIRLLQEEIARDLGSEN